MSSVIGKPPLTIEPEPCTELAPSAATFAAATMSVGALAATPLPEDEPPQPPSRPARSTGPSAETAGSGRRTRIAAGTLSVAPVGIAHEQALAEATLTGSGRPAVIGALLATAQTDSLPSADVDQIGIPVGAADPGGAGRHEAEGVA